MRVHSCTHPFPGVLAHIRLAPTRVLKHAWRGVGAFIRTPNPSHASHMFIQVFRHPLANKLDLFLGRKPDLPSLPVITESTDPCRTRVEERFARKRLENKEKFF